LAAPAPGERRAPVAAVELSLGRIEGWRRVGAGSLAVVREAAWAQAARVVEIKPWGTVDVVHETRDAGIYRLNVAPGAGIPLHRHLVMEEREMVLGEGLLCQGVLAAAGSVRRWPKGAPHRYDNPTDRWQTILCVDTPRFLPHDEIQVEPLGVCS
jgi:dihydroneopterin aldolase